jgi:hypothetical protein
MRPICEQGTTWDREINLKLKISLLFAATFSCDGTLIGIMQGQGGANDGVFKQIDRPGSCLDGNS